MDYKRSIMSIYIVGGALWVFAWCMGIDYLLQMRSTKLLGIPFFLTLAILLVNFLFLFKIEEPVNIEDVYDDELDKMQLIEKSAANMVTAITGVLIIAAAISVMHDENPIPKPVILFESAAFICAVVGVLPKYWIPSPKASWLFALRHFKTVFHTYSISFFLAGLLAIFGWLLEST